MRSRAAGAGRRRPRRTGLRVTRHLAAVTVTVLSRSLHEAGPRAYEIASGPGLPWADGPLARRRAGACRQGRPAPRAVSRRARARSVAHRAEPGGRGAGRARPPPATERAPLWPHRHLRRPLRAHRLRRPAVAARRDGRAAVARDPSGDRSHGARRPRRVRRLERVRGRARLGARRARVGARRAGSARRGPVQARVRVPRGARRARALGRARAPAPRREPARRRPRRVERRAGLRVRLRGPDGCGVGAPRDALRPHGRHRLDPVRARPCRLRRARTHRLRPRTARGRRDRGAASSSRASASRTARPPRAGALRRLRPAGPAIDGAVAFLEGAGSGGTSSCSAASSSGRSRTGRRRSGSASSASRPTAGAPRSARRLPTLGIPYALEHGVRLGETPLGRALLALLRFAWLETGRADLFTFLRSPFSGLERRSVDFVEGRLRGRAILEAGRVEEESERLRGAPVPALVELRGADPLAGAAGAPAHDDPERLGARGPPTTGDARDDARAYDAAERTLADLDAPRGSGGRGSRPRRCSRRSSERSPPGRRRRDGRVAVLDYARARTRAFDVVFLLGLEEGEPAAPRPPDAASRRRRAQARSGDGSTGPDSVARDRYLFYTACTRALRRLVLVREAASDDGVPREPSPFWHDVRALFDPADVGRATRRRALSSLTWPIDGAPSERERLRALARVSVDDPDGPRALAAANGWSRRLERARPAFDRPTRLRARRARLVLEQDDVLRDRASSASPTARPPGSSSASSRRGRSTPSRTRSSAGQVVHTALNRFYAMLPKELDAERVTPGEPRRRARARSALPRRRARVGRAARPHRPPGRRAAAVAARRPRGVRPRRGRVGRPVRPAPARGLVRLRPGGTGAAARPRRSGTASGSRARSTGSTSTRGARAASSRTTSRARARTRHARSTGSCASRSRSTSSPSATSSAWSRSAASTGRSRGSA